MIPFLEWGPFKLPDWAKVSAGAVAGALLALPVGYCSGAQAMKDKIAAKQLRADAASAARDAAVKESIGAARVQDSLKIQAQSKERTDAIQAGPDDRVSAAQRRLNCERLRDAGVPESKLAGRC